MSNYDDFLKETPKSYGRPKKADPDLMWNLLTVVMLLMTLCACVFILSILVNPHSSINPLAPPTLTPPPPTATLTPLGYEATWTPTITPVPTSTATPRPTYTMAPSPTLFTIPTFTPFYTPTTSLTPTRTVHPTSVPYTITVTYNDSTTFRADTSCSSMFVAGQALDPKNNPVLGLLVKLGGRVPGKTFTDPLVELTGISLVYGQSGFEFDLKIGPVASSKSLWIQLYDQSGAPLSEQYKLVTYSDCKKNLVLVRFQQK